MTQPADLTSALKEIRGRIALVNSPAVEPVPVPGDDAGNARLRLWLEDAPRLLALTDAVLDLHKPGRVTIVGALCPEHENHRFFSITRTEAADVAACPDCAGAVYETCAGCGTSARLDRCPIREAVSRALGVGQISSGELSSRELHLAWCKERALKYADRGDGPSAVASLRFDLGKHPGTRASCEVVDGLMLPLMLNGHLDSPAELRKFIEEFG